LELSWSTFVLEMINFLVLLWILKHFLYKPVLDTIARRQASIENTLNEAKKLRDEAGQLQQKYEGRIADWEAERQQARAAMVQSMEAEKATRMEELQLALQQQREKFRVAEERHRADSARQREAVALLQGGRFASRLLQLAAGPELQARLVELTITGLAELPAERVVALRNSYAGKTETAHVTSAFALTDEQRQRLEQALKRVTGTDSTLHFELDEKLLAGLRVLGATLLDELKGLAEFADDEK
jgi:F-type H+-transporting ATPase subunit b